MFTTTLYNIRIILGVMKLSVDKINCKYNFVLKVCEVFLATLRTAGKFLKTQICTNESPKCFWLYQIRYIEQSHSESGEFKTKLY